MERTTDMGTESQTDNQMHRPTLYGQVRKAIEDHVRAVAPLPGARPVAVGVGKATAAVVRLLSTQSSPMPSQRESVWDVVAERWVAHGRALDTPGEAFVSEVTDAVLALAVAQAPAATSHDGGEGYGRSIVRRHNEAFAREMGAQADT
jgi:hypothetical protein